MTRNRTRWLTRGGLGGALVGALLLFAPAAAQASNGWTGTLTPGSFSCVGEWPTYQLRAQGTANGGGIKWTLSKDGALLAQTQGKSFFVELRRSNGTFPGPAVNNYALCAQNVGTQARFVTISTLKDAEF